MILGLIEYENGTLTEATQQMLTFASELSKGSGLELSAVIIGGDNTAGLTEEIGKYGAGRIIKVEDERLKDYAPAAWAKAVCQLITDRGAKMVLAAGTDRGNEVLAHVGAMTNMPMAANCSAVSAGDTTTVTRLRWGSSLLEEAVIKGKTALLTIAQHVIEPQEAADQGSLAEESFSPDLVDSDFLVRVVRKESDEAEGITLKTAPVVVGGGRGVGSPEAYAVLEELAGEIGAAVGCTRVATNNGWRPHSDQVGLTGTRISPTLYIACGISGAIQHLVGCKGAKNILVINKDPEAAFFGKADYGVLGDLHEVLPAITEELRKAKAS